MSNKKKATGRAKVPPLLYHAAPQCVVDLIKEQGLTSGWGEIYASETPEDALSFMWMRLLSHFHGVEQVECPRCHGNDPACEACNGSGTVMLPQMVEHDWIAVCTIDTGRTSKELWELGVDHNPDIFTGTSWVYRTGSIPVWSIPEIAAYATRESTEGSDDNE